jgi:serine/threonine protein kinase
MPEIGDIISGKYRILGRLGSGAMGVVFVALNVDTEKRVALKWLNPALMSVPNIAERFRLEAKATGRVHHPNVVAVHDCGEHAGELYLVMEYLDGRTLRAHLTAATEHRLGLHEALGLMFPVMRGVAAAHGVSVLHRDLKPENVLLCESPDGLAPIPKVLDFGLAKVRSAAASHAATMSMPGSVFGTYQYMAPEQLRSLPDIDERVDVYALGATLYELLSGHPPHQADNAVDLVLEVLAGAAPALDGLVGDLPEGLSEVVEKALARERGERFASVEAFALALEPFAPLPFRGNAQVKSTPPALPGAARGSDAGATRGSDAYARSARPERSGVGTAVSETFAELRELSQLIVNSLHPAAGARTYLQVGVCLVTLFVQPSSMDLGAEHAAAADSNTTAPVLTPAAPEPDAPSHHDAPTDDWAGTAPQPSAAEALPEGFEPPAPAQPEPEQPVQLQPQLQPKQPQPQPRVAAPKAPHSPARLQPSVARPAPPQLSAPSPAPHGKPVSAGNLRTDEFYPHP